MIAAPRRASGKTRARVVRTEALMGTLVTIEVVGGDRGARARRDRDGRVGEAFEWFRKVEETCTRFNPESELMRATAAIDVAVPVSDILFHALTFACAVAGETDGAFDPTVGRAMEGLGFDEEYNTGRRAPSTIAHDAGASYRDVVIDPDRRTIRLTRPMVLDLGGVVKGLAIDLAAAALAPLENFAIDAGGDLFLGGHNADGAPWSVGVRHPREGHALLSSLQASDIAVCTSGDYERRAATGRAGHHIDPRRASPAAGVASATVIAPTAIVADAFSTAAFILGPGAGLALLERAGVEGLIVSADGRHVATPGMPGLSAMPGTPGRNDAILSHA